MAIPAFESKYSMIFPLEKKLAVDKSLLVLKCPVKEISILILRNTVVSWCYFYTVKQQPCRKIRNSLIIKYFKLL